jgi:hypothetical protein
MGYLEKRYRKDVSCVSIGGLMSKFLKQPPQHPKKPRKTEKDPDPGADYRISDFRHSCCVEEALDGLTSVISTYVTQARNGDNGSGLYSDPSSYPVKVEFEGGVQSLNVFLYGDALDIIADSLKRIADAMAMSRGLTNSGT